MSSARRPTDLSRRRVLRWGAAGLAAPVVAPALGGCLLVGSDRPDPLIALAQAAQTDAALIDATARAAPALATRLAPVAEARRAHLSALQAEVSRLDPDATVPPPSSAAATSPATPQAAAPTGLDGVRAALDSSARAATEEVPGLPGFRAALVGSVAACCGAYRVVLE